jgi:hypothetical protein
VKEFVHQMVAFQYSIILFKRVDVEIIDVNGKMAEESAKSLAEQDNSDVQVLDGEYLF